MKSVKIENGLKFIRGFKTPEFESEFEISVILKEINDRPNLNLAIQCNKCDPEFLNTVFTINEDYCSKPKFHWGDRKELTKYLTLNEDNSYPLI